MSYKIGIDGNEEGISKEYQKNLNYFKIIKKMCDNSHKIKPSMKKPVYEDYLIKDMGLPEDIGADYYRIDKELYEWNKKHFLLDNGLHVYIRNGKMQILEEELNMDFGDQQRGFTLDDDGTITMYIGKNNLESPYFIEYKGSGKEIYSVLPVNSVEKSNNGIKEILEGGLKYFEAKNNEEKTELYKNTIGFYDKISDIVRESLKFSEKKQIDSEQEMDEEVMLIDESKFAQIYGKSKGKIKEVFSKIKAFFKPKVNDKEDDKFNDKV